ncbi:MAG: DUF1127 domain-containing protein [Pseudomonadota bacterium]
MSFALATLKAPLLSAEIEALKQRYAAYQVYRTTLNELRVLTARDLADLGISRSMIRSIALEAAYG